MNTLDKVKQIIGEVTGTNMDLVPTYAPLGELLVMDSYDEELIIEALEVEFDCDLMVEFDCVSLADLGGLLDA